MALTRDRGMLTFTFPEVDPNARLHLAFQRTFRTPRVAEVSSGLPDAGRLRLAQGSPAGDADAVVPMWQSEAAWIDFTSPDHHPFLVVVGVDGVNVISGEPYSPRPDFDRGDYFEVPTQPTVAARRTASGSQMQFVAPPNAATRHQTAGGRPDESSDGTLVELSVIPMRAEAWSRRRRHPGGASDACVVCDISRSGQAPAVPRRAPAHVYGPLESVDTWHPRISASAAVRIVNSAAWDRLTGRSVPHEPLTCPDYVAHRLPWYPSYREFTPHSSSL